MTGAELGAVEGAPVVEHALAYARRGFEIMPRVERHGRLLDAVSGSPRTGFVGEGEVRAYWADHPDMPALAVVCGPTSGVLVLDVDQHEGGADGLAELRRLEAEHGSLPPAPFVLTPTGRGRHLYFGWPAGRRLRNGAIASGLEILGDRCAATLPPSQKGGRPYRWSRSRHPDFVPFADAPRWLLEMATPPPPPIRRAAPQEAQASARYIAAAIERELDAVRSARPGDRNNALNRASWVLARFLDTGSISAGELEAVLVDAAASAGLLAREAVATVRGALRGRAAA